MNIHIHIQIIIIIIIIIITSCKGFWEASYVSFVLAVNS